MRMLLSLSECIVKVNYCSLNRCDSLNSICFFSLDYFVCWSNHWLAKEHCKSIRCLVLWFSLEYHTLTV